MKYRKLKGYKYQLMKMYRVRVELPDTAQPNTIGHYLHIRKGVLTILKHYNWDGASGLAIDNKTNMRASLIHDGMYQLMREGLLNRSYRKYADLFFRDILLEDGMSKFRAWYYYLAVRAFGKKSSFPVKQPRGKIIEI